MELFRLLGTIAIDNSNANTAINETTNNAVNGSNETSEAFKKIGTVAGGIAKGIGTIGMAMGGAWIAAIEGTREYRQDMGKLETAFLATGKSADTAQKTYKELNGVLGDSGQAVEASQHLAKLTDNEKDLQTWTDICTGVYATFGESLPIEGLTEAANETAKVGVVTGPLADALNWAGISEDKFNVSLAKCSNEQERQKLIMDTLNGTYKGASDQYKETNKDVIEAQKANDNLTKAFARLGEIGEPIMTAIKNKVVEAMNLIIPKLEEAIEKIKDGINWVKQNEDTIHTWVAVIIGATVAIGTFLLILNWGAIMSAAANALNTLRIAIVAVNTALKANPIGLVVSLIAGLVVAIIYLWNTNESFRKFWINTWGIIKKTAIDAWNAIKATWNGAKAFFSGIWSGIKGVFGSVGSWFSSTFRSAWNNVKSAFSGWGSFFGGLWSNIKSRFSSIGSSLGSAMSNAVSSGMNRVIGKIESVINSAINMINKAIRLTNKLPGIKVGTIGSIRLPRLEEGGILKKGQIGFLEGTGAEAVVPLEKNTQWIGNIAKEMKSQLNIKESSFDIPENLYDRMDRILDKMDELMERNIFLDTGLLVGEMAPAINNELGNLYNYSKRHTKG